MYIYVCVCVYIYICVCVCIYIYVCVCVYVYVYRRFPCDTETPDIPEFQYVGRQLRFVY